MEMKQNTLKKDKFLELKEFFKHKRVLVTGNTGF